MFFPFILSKNKILNYGVTKVFGVKKKSNHACPEKNSIQLLFLRLLIRRKHNAVTLNSINLFKNAFLENVSDIFLFNKKSSITLKCVPINNSLFILNY